MKIPVSMWVKGGRHAIGAGVLSSLVFVAAPVFSQDSEEPEEEAVELRTVTVTGSRIKRVDVEGDLPVTIIDREMIELSGETSLQDLLRSLPFNSAGSYRSHMDGRLGAVDMGTSQIDLRGLGAGRSLVLIDGRRLPKAATSTEVQSINTIPMGAVERIEILSDGASAIYGSDAIGGVINIITRKDYRGWELMYGRAEPEWGGGKRDKGTLMFGASGERSNLLINLSWNNREVSYNRDFPDVERALVLSDYFSSNFIPTDPETGFPLDAWTPFPGSCEDSDNFYLVPEALSLTGEICLYDWSRVASNETSEETRGLLVKFEREINPAWRFWIDTSATQVEAFGRFAPAPGQGQISADSPNNPTNPDSPMFDPAFGPNVPVIWLHRFEALGFRYRTRENTLVDVQLGIDGWLGGVELEAGVRNSWNQTDGEYLNVIGSNVYQFINDGSYNLQSPSSTPAEILDQMRAEYPEEYRYDQAELFATLSWDLFETSTGPLQWVLGGEFRREKYRGETSEVTFDDVVPYFEEAADRDTTSLFFETLVPLTPDFELSLAGRYDSYSDWGSEFSPKISARWRLTDQLVTRGSWGEGFRAPPLWINTFEPGTYQREYAYDPQSCAAINRPYPCVILYELHWGISPSFGAETSEQHSLGLVWEPSDWFSQTIDYWDITVDDQIGTFYPAEIIGYDKRGLPQPPGLGVRRDASGLLLEVFAGYGNLGLVESSGLDLNAKVQFDLGPGRWRSDLLYSHWFNYEWTIQNESSGNLVGTHLVPPGRGTLSNYYDISDWTFSWVLHYIAAQRDENPHLWYGGTDPSMVYVPSLVTHDLQFNYHAPWDGRFTLGVQNVTGKTAPYNAAAGDEVLLYDSYGRVYYAEYTQTFD